MSIPQDVQEFLLGYPHSVDKPTKNKNLRFYQGHERCQPDNLLIDELLEQWNDDFETLEYEHGFIQWLFPIRERGMNSESQPLQLHEIHAMRADKAVINRVYGSYILMLSFYGITLLDFRTGLLSRSENYVSRYKNLCQSPHNYLRVTRILKSLSEFGLEHLNAGLLLYFLWEQSENNQLNVSRLKSSMDRWWANCIRDEEERTMVNDLIGQVRSEELKFTREKYEAVLERRMKVTKARRKARREEQERQAQEREHGHGHEHQHGHGHGHEHRHGPERQYRPEHHYRQEHHFGQEHQYEGQERRRDERHHRQEHQYGQERHHRQEHQYAPEHQYGSDPPPYEQEYQHHGHQHPYAPEHQHGHEHQYAPEHQRGREHQHEQEHQHEHERQCEHGEEEAQGYMEEEEQDQVQEVGQGSALHQGHTMEQRHTTEQQPMEQPPVEENDIDISEEMTVDVAPKVRKLLEENVTPVPLQRDMESPLIEGNSRQ